MLGALQLWFGIILLCCCNGRCLVVEAFYGSDHVVIDATQPHDCPQSCMPNSVERLLEAHEDMVKALLVLQVFAGVAGISHKIF